MRSSRDAACCACASELAESQFCGTAIPSEVIIDFMNPTPKEELMARLENKDEEHIDRLAAILQLQAQGVSPDEIRAKLKSRLEDEDDSKQIQALLKK